MPLETERRYLIKLPLSISAKELYTQDPDTHAEITQTYLKTNDGSVERVRSVNVAMWSTIFSHYTHTVKRSVSHGVNEEDERALEAKEFSALLEQADPERHTITKTRYFIHHEGKLFELDLFHGEHEGLAILEVELSSMDEAFELPPYLGVVREITGEVGYSNYELAKGSK